MVYIYKCLTCEHKFEKFNCKIDSKAPKCERCENKTVKVPVASNFILKGIGWAKDGYKGNK